MPALKKCLPPPRFHPPPPLPPYHKKGLEWGDAYWHWVDPRFCSSQMFYSFTVCSGHSFFWLEWEWNLLEES